MVDLSIQELILGHELAFLPEKAAGVNAVIQYRLSGESGGDWIITIKDGKCHVEAGLAENPKITLLASASDFKDILEGKVNGMMAFMQGKLKVQGDINLAMKFQSFFSSDRR